MPSELSKHFTYRKETALNKLFNVGGNPFISQDTVNYQGKIEDGEKERSWFPLLSMDENGSTDLSIHHMRRLKEMVRSPAGTDEFYRLVVSTAAKESEQFNMDRQTDVQVIQAFPTVHSVKVTIPSITELFKVDNNEAV